MKINFKISNYCLVKKQLSGKNIHLKFNYYELQFDIFYINIFL